MVNVPESKFIAEDAEKNASFKETDDPAAMRTPPKKGRPLLVIVCAAPELNIKDPVYVLVTATDESVKFPKMLIVCVPAITPVNPVRFRFLQLPVAATVTVTVPDAASKNTSSALVGTLCPPAPPDVAAHLVPAVPSQLAVPPTQKRSGIAHLFCWRGSYRSNPVVHTLLLQGLNFFVGEGVVVRQMQGITEQAVRSVKFKVDLHATAPNKNARTGGRSSVYARRAINRPTRRCR